MDIIKLMIRSTPNPYAKKFICNFDVKSRGKVSFTSEDDCKHIPLASALWAIEGITQVHFFENVVTVTQSGHRSWEELATDAERVIKSLLPEHDPDFETAEQARRRGLPTELLRIEEILDKSIRPALQGDGGDLEVLELDGNLLYIKYEGACGSCPSATTGTLSAIQGTLRAEYNPNLEVIPIDIESH